MLHDQPCPTLPQPAGDLAALWTGLVEAVGRASPFTRHYLLEAHPVSFTKNLFVIGFDPEFEDHLALVDNPRNHDAAPGRSWLNWAMPNAQIKFVKAEDAGARSSGRPQRLQRQRLPPCSPHPRRRPSPSLPPPPVPRPRLPKAKPAPVSFSKEDFKNDPLIQKALGDFQGPDRRGPRLKFRELST